MNQHERRVEMILLNHRAGLISYGEAQEQLVLADEAKEAACRAV